MSDQTKVLALWLAEQQQASRLAQQQTATELHLHQHHHAAPAPPPVAEPEQPQTVRLHPLVLATYALLLSIAISVPLALLGAMVDALNRPTVQYVQPSRGGW